MRFHLVFTCCLSKPWLFDILIVKKVALFAFNLFVLMKDEYNGTPVKLPVFENNGCVGEGGIGLSY